MYHFGGPQFGLLVTLPSAIASANGPHAAALSLSDSDSLTANQLQNHVTQARRARERLIDQISKPPEPGWKSAVNQINETVDRMEKVLSFLQTASPLHARPVEDMEALAVFPSGTAMQQSGRTPDVPPSAAESPTEPSSARATFAAAARAEPTARVIYVMDDGVVIIGLPPQAPATGSAPSTADASDRSSPEARVAQGDPPYPLPRRARLDAQMQVTADIRAEDWREDEAVADQASGFGTPQATPEVAAVIPLPLTEDQRRASQDLLSLARKAYAQFQMRQDDPPGALVSSAKVGLTAALSNDPATPPSPERLEPRPAPRGLAAEPAKLADSRSALQEKDPMFAPTDPFAQPAAQEAAEASRAQKLVALQLEGRSDMIYIVAPARTSMDLIA